MGVETRLKIITDSIDLSIKKSKEKYETATNKEYDITYEAYYNLRGRIEKEREKVNGNYFIPQNERSNHFDELNRLVLELCKKYPRYHSRYEEIKYIEEEKERRMDTPFPDNFGSHHIP
ncbi:MAG: hypothetical protein AABW83_02995 [Nanoarchaeota archaeon]